MNKSKFYIIIIGVLLLANVLLARVIFFSNSGKHPEPKKTIIEKLHFDAVQVKEYEKLIQQHRNSISVLDASMLEARNLLHRELLNTPDPNKVDSIKKEIGRMNEEVTMVHFNHFYNIKKLCKPEQLDEFNVLINELGKMFSKPKHKK